MTEKRIMNLGLTMYDWKTQEELLSRANVKQLQKIKEMIDTKLIIYYETLKCQSTLNTGEEDD